VKHVGFNLGAKDRERVMDEQNGETEEEEVMGEGINESEIGETGHRYQNEVNQEIKGS